MPSLGLIAFELRSYMSHFAAIFWTLVYPVLMLLFLIFIFDNASERARDLGGYRFDRVTGLLAINIAATAMFSISHTLCEMRVHRMLMSYCALPLSSRSILVSVVISRLIILLAFGLVFLPASFIILDVRVELGPFVLLKAAIAVIATGLFACSISLLGAYLAKNPTTVFAVSNVLNIYIILSSDAVIPLSALPEWSHLLVESSPFYYLTEMIRMAFEPGASVPFFIAVCALTGIGLAITLLSARTRLLAPSV